VIGLAVYPGGKGTPRHHGHSPKARSQVLFLPKDGHPRDPAAEHAESSGVVGPLPALMIW
jgi:hypothetical protein